MLPFDDIDFDFKGWLNVKLDCLPNFCKILHNVALLARAEAVFEWMCSSALSSSSSSFKKLPSIVQQIGGAVPVHLLSAVGHFTTNGVKHGIGKVSRLYLSEKMTKTQAVRMRTTTKRMMEGAIRSMTRESSFVLAMLSSQRLPAKLSAHLQVTEPLAEKAHEPPFLHSQRSGAASGRSKAALHLPLKDGLGPWPSGHEHRWPPGTSRQA
ncbi:hypothetical protein TYRP_019602 [Tyrophagus putrescentiae]|nr:hypothetical protein TYRP_019602 [Tyrophagus putrescentiae]